MSDRQKMKPIPHAPIPKNPWDKIVIAMQEEPCFLVQEATTELQRREDFLWGVLAHYLYKKRWNSKHKISWRQSLVQGKAIQAYGDFWNSLIELCVNCHGYAPPNSRNYNNAAQWIALIIQEKRSLKNSKIAEGNIKKGGKIKLAELLRAKAKLLEEERNPEDKRITPHAFWLYEDSLHLMQQGGNVFRKNYWIPHIRALRTHIREFENNPTWVSQWIENGQHYEQNGKGRGKNLVLPPKGVLT
jgi:hypothetical protein